MPLVVSERGPVQGLGNRLQELKAAAQREKKAIAQLEPNKPSDSADHKQRARRLAALRTEIGRLQGAETNASVDSELSMVLFEAYDLYRWQPNALKDGEDQPGTRVKLLVEGPAVFVFPGNQHMFTLPGRGS